MNDYTLMLAENATVPAMIPGVTNGRTLLPDLLTPNYLEFAQVMDLARGGPVYANFRLEQAFNIVAGNVIRYAMFTSNDPAFLDLLTNDELELCCSHPITSGGLQNVGDVISIALPPAGALLRVNGEGRRLIAPGLVYTVPTTLWSQGRLSVWLSPQALPQRPAHYPAGY